MRILVAAGSSGGHIFPAVSFLEALKERYAQAQALLVLPERSRKRGITVNNLKVKYISICPLKPSLSRVFLFVLRQFIKGSLESLFILIKFEPDIVVGFGGLECVPLVSFAWFFRIKTLIHEQNVIPGKANRLLSKFVDKTAISFEETRNYLRVSQDSVVFTGNPVRKELRIKRDRLDALNFFGFDEEKFNVLVMGGSQGSHKINACFLKVISALTDKSKIQVIHISGSRDYALLSDSYKGINIKVKLFSFLSQMQCAYSACDLVISRAGATTISELIYFGVPAILVPYPFASKHQAANARVLEKIGSAIVIDEGQLEAVALKDMLSEFINNPDKLKAMRSRYDCVSRISAHEALVNAVME